MAQQPQSFMSEHRLWSVQSGLASRAMASAAKDDKYDFDLFTIGGGTGGVRAARFASMDYGKFVCTASSTEVITAKERMQK